MALVLNEMVTIVTIEFVTINTLLFSMTKNSHFDLEAFLPYRLNQAAEAVSLEFQDIYRRDYGMTRSEWRVFAHLGQYGRLTATEIGKKSGLHKTKISRAVFALEKRRWLQRQQDTNDRRQEHLVLTKLGSETYQRLGEQALNYDAQLRSRLSESEVDALIAILRKF